MRVWDPEFHAWIERDSTGRMISFDCTDDHRKMTAADLGPPIVCLPLMTRPTREAEKGTKFLPDMWKPNA